MKIYRYDMIGAPPDRHPQEAILALAPDATWLIPESLFDCWTFVAEEIENPPSYVRELNEPTQTMLKMGWPEPRENDPGFTHKAANRLRKSLAQPEVPGEGVRLGGNAMSFASVGATIGGIKLENCSEIAYSGPAKCFPEVSRAMGTVGPIEIYFPFEIVHEKLPPETLRRDAAAIIGDVAYPAEAFPVSVLVGFHRCVIQLPGEPEVKP